MAGVFSGQEGLDESLEAVSKGLQGLTRKAAAAGASMAKLHGSLGARAAAASTLLQQVTEALTAHAEALAETAEATDSASGELERAGERATAALEEAGEATRAGSEEVEAAAATLEEDLATAGERAAGSSEGLAGAAETLTGATGEGTAQLQEAGARVDGALEALVTAVDGAEGALAGAVDGLRGKIEEVVSGLAAAATAAHDRIEATAAEHQQNLGAMTGAVVEWADEEAGAALARVKGEIETPVVAAVEALLGPVAELETQLEEVSRRCDATASALDGCLASLREVAASGRGLAATAVHISRSTGI